MNKMLSLVLAGLVAIVVGGCGGDDGPNQSAIHQEPSQNNSVDQAGVQGQVTNAAPNHGVYHQAPSVENEGRVIAPPDGTLNWQTQPAQTP
jgi:hypothetical protein